MALPDFLPGRFALARGRSSDYFALEHFHYLPRRPATYADVWVVIYHENDALYRAALDFGDHDPRESLWRNAAHREDMHPPSRVVAVGVLSFPSFRSAPRERVLNLTDLSHRPRLRFTNDHLRTISRVVVHPQFRGLGLASELVRKLIETCPTRYVEASAVMARVHPFFEAAGMRRVECDDREYDHETRPAYFIFDKEQGSPCDADDAKPQRLASDP